MSENLIYALCKKTLSQKESTLAKAKINLCIPNDKNETSLVIKDENHAIACNVLPALVENMKKGDMMICVTLAYLDRQNVYKEAGFKSSVQFAIALTGLDRDTLNAYTDIGKKFYEVDGKPKKDYVLHLTKAHFNQAKSLLNDEKWCYGHEVNHDFLDCLVRAIMDKNNHKMCPVPVWNEILRAIRNGDIPARLLDHVIEKDKDGNNIDKYYLDKLEMVGYVPPVEDKPEDKDKDKPEDKPEDKSEDKTERTIEEDLARVSERILSLNMTDDERKNIQILVASLVEFVGNHTETENK